MRIAASSLTASSSSIPASRRSCSSRIISAPRPSLVLMLGCNADFRLGIFSTALLNFRPLSHTIPSPLMELIVSRFVACVDFDLPNTRMVSFSNHIFSLLGGLRSSPVDISRNLHSRSPFRLVSAKNLKLGKYPPALEVLSRYVRGNQRRIQSLPLGNWRGRRATTESFPPSGCDLGEPPFSVWP